MRTSALSTSAVIERGASLADANGFAALTIADVARSLNVQAPSLYSHVRNLQALRDGIAILALQELADRIVEAIMGRAAKAALTGFADAHRSFARARPGCWEALQTRQGDDVAAAPAARRLVQATSTVLLGYGIAPGEHVHATRIVGSAINGFVTLERVGNFAHSAPPADSTWPRLIDALDSVLQDWAARPTTPADPNDPDNPNDPNHPNEGTP